MIHVEATVQTIRIIEEGVPYGGPFKAILTVQRTGCIATICGLHGTIEYSDYVELFDFLSDTGIGEVYCWVRDDESRRTRQLKPRACPGQPRLKPPGLYLHSSTNLA